MVGSLLVISPVLTGIVLATGGPALVAQLRLSRRRTAMMWDIGPAERRQLFYGDLLGTVEAAKEIRLFASGRFLHDRMMSELRATNAARRRMVDRRRATPDCPGCRPAAITSRSRRRSCDGLHAVALKDLLMPPA
ncbi:hypothetical protein [Nonomuraea insulae]|uniref:ABC transmembrane type-1 domain-containing protein n=1 Tax=Nonomuraea insulae TaxID=1616787 RepID=A0ABW1CL50_9ACTN